MATARNKITPPTRARESGNAFIFVMIGIVLFAALMITFSRSARQGGENISERQAELIALDLLTYTQTLSTGVNRVLRNNCSENDISFYVAGRSEAAYQHTPDVEEKCKVFSQSGGGLSWIEPNSESYNAAGGSWVIAGSNQIAGIGGSGGEITLMIFHLKKSVCYAVLKKMGDFTSAPLSDGWDDARFDGTLPAGVPFTATPSISGKSTGCVYWPDDERYIFYSVLLAR